MRNRIHNILVVIAILSMGTMATASSSMAQTVDLGSTPEAPPAERDPNSTSGEPQGPVFGIVAVGDHPTGYFDNVEVTPGSSVELAAAIVNQGSVPVSLHTYKINALSGTNGGFVAGNEADPPRRCHGMD